MRLVSFKPLIRNTLRGLCEIELPSGLRIREISIHTKIGKSWAGLPARLVIDGEGRHHTVDRKRQYGALLEWRSRELSEEFSRRRISRCSRRRERAMSRGRSQRSKDLIEAAHDILLEIEPATVRAVCYKLFVARLIDSMAKSETNKISRLLTLARENDEIPWQWIVDETREAERISAWDNPQAFARAVISSHRRDYWSQQPIVVELWSEKGTVRGTLAPILEKYGVTFRVMHGYSSATAIRQVADESAEQSRLVLYVGDWDPSGLHMSEVDLPRRLREYGADVKLIRVALADEDIANSGLPHFAAADKRSDPRYRWFIQRYGKRCFEVDALDPNILRDRVERCIRSTIDFDAWDRCKAVEQAEHQSLIEVMKNWGRSVTGPWQNEPAP
jgi:hypothetical protein